MSIDSQRMISLKEQEMEESATIRMAQKSSKILWQSS